MKYVVCVPDGCADEPLESLGGRTPLEVASMPTLRSLAGRGRVGRAAVIPVGLPPGSDVGNMSIFGYDPARFHTGRAPIEAAALGLKLAPDQVAYRCNLVTVDRNGTMVDFAGGHPTSDDAAPIIKALDEQLGGEVRFHAGVEYRHIMVAPASWVDADCTPPHDLSDKAAVYPTGPAAPQLRHLMDASRDVLSAFGTKANQIWLWGQGFQPQMPSFESLFGRRAALTSAVDLVRGLGVLTDVAVVDVPGATAGYDNDYGAQRDAAIHALRNGTDLFIIHVEASDEAGHAGDVAEKVRSLELWDREILTDLVAELDGMGPWRMLLLPDHATPLRLKTHTSDPVPYLLYDSEVAGPGGEYNERYVADAPVFAGHDLMAQLVGDRSPV
ncbi:MAG: 2,3-bisphosphoglycerate-independent phosphoglycerate mutase [Acidimicrobiales bacterium]